MNTTRPTLRLHTAELDAVKAQAAAQVAACQRSEVVITDDVARSGHLVYFTYAVAQYSLATLCSCAGITVSLVVDGTPRDYLNATATCPTCGPQQATALRCYTTPAHQTTQAFAWVEQRHARDRRVGWGMHTSPAQRGRLGGGQS